MVAFSIATRSLPEGFPPDALAREVREATTSSASRDRADRCTTSTGARSRAPQGILETLVAHLGGVEAGRRLPAVAWHDVTRITRRSPKRGCARSATHTILGYEIPWNNFDFAYQWYVALENKHTRRRCPRSKSMRHSSIRRYANPEYVWNVARTHGINVNREYPRCSRCTEVIV